MTMFRQKYRVESTRLRPWDYAWPGWYFVTISTRDRFHVTIRDRACYFGDVVNGAMRLSSVGEIVAEEWSRTKLVRPYVELDQWVIMPNHLHGIIVIINNPSVETPRRGVSTPPVFKPGSLGSIIGQFKSVCTKRVRTAGCHDFMWQRRFYDHIIRNEESLGRIREYIVNNPMKWDLDKDNPANLHM